MSCALHLIPYSSSACSRCECKVHNAHDTSTSLDNRHRRPEAEIPTGQPCKASCSSKQSHAVTLYCCRRKRIHYMPCKHGMYAHMIEHQRCVRLRKETVVNSILQVTWKLMTKSCEGLLLSQHSHLRCLVHLCCPQQFLAALFQLFPLPACYFTLL
jgi:hypothetical protein